MTITETAYAKINLALLVAALLVGCAPVDAPKAVLSGEKACERVMSVLAANKTYRAEQMAGCDGGKDDNKPGYYVLRVNGSCHEPEGCGSVLLGWYAVEEKTGAVHEIEVSEWQIGRRIDREN
jgi:hypothetical protein